MRFGPYGKGLGKWSLKEALEEWDRIRAWSKHTGLDPMDLKRLEQAAESFLDRSDTRERTKAGYLSSLNAELRCRQRRRFALVCALMARPSQRTTSRASNAIRKTCSPRTQEHKSKTSSRRILLIVTPCITRRRNHFYRLTINILS